MAASRNSSLLLHIPPSAPVVLPLSSTFNVSVPLPVILIVPRTLSNTLPVLFDC